MGKSKTVTFTNVSRVNVVVSKDGQKVRVGGGEDVELSNDREVQLADGNHRLVRAGKDADKRVKDSAARREHVAMEPGPKAFPAEEPEYVDGDGKNVTGTLTSDKVARKGKKSKSPAKAAAKDTGSGPVKGRTVPQLRALAAERGVTVKGKSGKKPTKADYVKALSSS